MLFRSILRGQLDTPYAIKAQIVNGEIAFEMAARPVEAKPADAKTEAKKK